MAGSLLRLAILVVVLGAIIGTAWNEPLRYRFMSSATIAQEEAALFPTPPPASRTGPDWRQYGTALDRAPYVRSPGGGVTYTHNYDHRQVGTSTETTARENMNQSGANAYRPGVGK